ncbi:MAG: MIP/aquaporin family protein [Rivularia sp. (in: cyanobacteria)]
MNRKALIAEFIGTFALIFIGVSAIATNHIIKAGDVSQVDLLAIAVAHGLTIAVMVSATAAVSGGHLNPAVTFGALVGGKIDFKNAVAYIIFQCLGGIFAASLVKLCIPLEVLQAVDMGTPTLGKNITPSMGLVMEFIMTFFLVFVVFGTAIDRRAPKMGGLFIGLTVALDILAGGAISGAAMNPARYLGPALIRGGLQNFWLYWIGLLAGGGFAALVYHYLLEENSATIRGSNAPEIKSNIR